MSNKSLENRHRILRALDAARYGLTVTEIAETIGLSSRNTARYLSFLCKEDVLGRRKNANDRTVYFLLSRAPFRAKVRGVGSAGKNVHCIVRVNNYYREEVERSLFKRSEIFEENDENFLFSFEAPHINDAIRFVLEKGGFAMAVEPIELRQHVMEFLENALNQYKKAT